MPKVAMRESAMVILDASGGGIAKVGPLSTRETWHPETVEVSANANPISESQCIIYVGNDRSAQNQRDATTFGSSGDKTSRVGGALRTGEYIWAVWTSGDAGAQGLLIVKGMKDV
jgi:hypothetical protein